MADEIVATVIPSKVPITPDTIRGVSPGEAGTKPNAVSGNAFDVFDRGLGETPPVGEAPSLPPSSAVPAPPKEAVSPPAPVNPPPFDLDKLTPDFKPKSEHWKLVNSERARLKEELSALKKQMEDLGDVQTLKNLAGEKAELEKQLRLVAAERDPEFQRQYTEGRKALIEEAMSAVPNELSGQVENILKRHGAGSASFLREFIKEHELDAFSQSQLASAVANLRALEANRERTVRSSAENWDKLITEQRLAAQRNQEQREREQAALLDERLTIAQKENILFQASTEEEKPEVEESVAIAKRVVGGDLDPEERVNVALSAAAYPRLVKQYRKLHEEYSKLQKTAAELRGLQPGAGGVGGGAGGGSSGEEYKGTGRGHDAGDILVKSLRAAGL